MQQTAASSTSTERHLNVRREDCDEEGRRRQPANSSSAAGDESYGANKLRYAADANPERRVW